MANDASLLRAALVGYQSQLSQIDNAIADLRKRIGEKGDWKVAKPRVRRALSAAARKRRADAQKKRWAAFHSQNQKVS